MIKSPINIFISFTILMLFITSGCSSLHITVPASLKSHAQAMPIDVTRKMAINGDVKGRVKINVGGIKTESLSVTENSSTSTVSRKGVFNISDSSTSKTEQYSFQMTRIDQSKVDVSCLIARVIKEPTLHLNETDSVGSVEKLKTSLKCEAEVNGESIGHLSIDRSITDKTLRATFQYFETTYQIDSIHTVQKWGFKRRSPYGYTISNDATLLSAVQVYLPLRLLTKSTISTVDFEATLFFFLSVAYYGELYSSLMGIF